MKRCVPLEPAAEEVCQANSKPPLIFELPLQRGKDGSGKGPGYACVQISRPGRQGAGQYRKMGTIPVWLVDPGFPASLPM